MIYADDIMLMMSTRSRGYVKDKNEYNDVRKQTPTVKLREYSIRYVTQFKYLDVTTEESISFLSHVKKED